MPGTEEQSQHPETNHLGRYTLAQGMTKEDELYAIILSLVRQGCGTGTRDKFDSWAISAYEWAIEELESAGFVEIEAGGRIFAKVLPKADEFEAWIEAHRRCKRVIEARLALLNVPDMTPERAARFCNVTTDELIDDIEIELQPSGEELPVASPSYQCDLRDFLEKLDASKIPYSSFITSLHSTNALDYLASNFSIAGAIAIALASSLKEILVAWMKARAGRKVKISVGKTQIEASTVEEIERLIPRVAELYQNQTAKKVDS